MMSQPRVIHIWEPRYHDSHVLIKDRRVLGNGMCAVVFTKTSNYPGKYMMEAEQIRTYPKTWNGGCNCHQVPLADFEVVA